MGLLFFFISFTYAFIFYLFYSFSLGKDIYFNDVSGIKISQGTVFDYLSPISNFEFYSLFGNLLIETVIFIILGIFLFFYFSSAKNSEKIVKENIDDEEIFNGESEKSIKKVFTYIISNFGKVSYYIGLLLFYFSIYIIAKSINIFEFSYIILGMNLIFFSFFFASKYSDISRDFLRINSILFSFYYILNYIYIIFTGEYLFNGVDLLNGLLVLLIFPVLVFYEQKINNKSYFDNTLLTHFFIYLFIFILFYSYKFLLREDIIYWLTILSTSFSFFLFDIFPQIKILKNNKYILKLLGLVFLYLSVIFGIYFLIFTGFSYLVIISLIFSILFNYYVHKKFQNYISFIVSFIAATFLLNYLFFHYGILDTFRDIKYLFFSVILSFLFIGVTYIRKFKYLYDYYFVHFYSYLVNIIGVILYLFNNFDVLNMGIVLLIDSIFFFVSYERLKKLKTKKKTIGLN